MGRRGAAAHGGSSDQLGRLGKSLWLLGTRMTAAAVGNGSPGGAKSSSAMLSGSRNSNRYPTPMSLTCSWGMPRLSSSSARGAEVRSRAHGEADVVQPDPSSLKQSSPEATGRRPNSCPPGRGRSHRGKGTGAAHGSWRRRRRAFQATSKPKTFSALRGGLPLAADKLVRAVHDRGGLLRCPPAGECCHQPVRLR
jgi:hypothetical protein